MSDLDRTFFAADILYSDGEQALQPRAGKEIFQAKDNIPEKPQLATTHWTLNLLSGVDSSLDY